jgi:hypothetical protein
MHADIRNRAEQIAQISSHAGEKIKEQQKEYDRHFFRWRAYLS